MRQTILEIPIDWLTLDEAMRKIAQFVVSKKPHHVTTVNPEFIVESQKNDRFRRALQAADMSLADGVGIILAQELHDQARGKLPAVRFLTLLGLGVSYIFGRTSRYFRLTGVDLSEKIIARAAGEGWRIYLLGGRAGVADKAGKIWAGRYPGLMIAGTSSVNPTETAIIPNINRVKPDILLVAYGAPKQELFIADKRTKLGVPVSIGVGGTFDTVVGTKYGPSPRVKSAGLEWLAYLIRYPNRLGRIWRATVVFSWLIARSR